MLAYVLECLKTASCAGLENRRTTCLIPRLTAQAEFDRLRRQELQREALRMLVCWFAEADMLPWSSSSEPGHAHAARWLP